MNPISRPHTFIEEAYAPWYGWEASGGVTLGQRYDMEEYSRRFEDLLRRRKAIAWVAASVGVALCNDTWKKVAKISERKTFFNRCNICWIRIGDTFLGVTFIRILGLQTNTSSITK